MAKLTNMQEKFCQNVAVKDMTYSAAYRDAYNTENYKPESINVRASELMANSNILVRVDQLKERKTEKILKAAVYDYEAHMKELEEIKQLALTPNGDNGKLELTTAGKMVELKGKVSELYNFVNKVASTDLSPEEFYKKVEEER